MTRIRFYIIPLLILRLIIFGSSDIAGDETSSQKQSKPMQNNTQILSGLIVKKPFVNKAGEASKFKEYYFRTSVQDYFIKFCESEISKRNLENHLSKIPDTGLDGAKAITAEITVKEGEWDICNEDHPAQSRIGYYVVIHRLIK